MTRTSDFSTIQGVAEIKWELKTATPLCIKSGTTSSWNQATDGYKDNPKKLRLYNAKFDFFKKDIDKESADASVADFYYDSYIKGGELKIRYLVPASSVRGALRSYTLKRLVKKDYWNVGSTEKDQPEDKKEKKRKSFQDALTQPGWRLIQNMFGLATDNDDEALENENEYVAGRLKISVGDLDDIGKKDFATHLISGNLKNPIFGSTRGKMAITTRNPLDKITNAAKDGGLHSVMELSEGNVFSVSIRILNPEPKDLGLIAFWEQGIESGLLRLGGLTSVGRGRLNIQKTDVNLFLKEAGRFHDLPEATNHEDILDSIFKTYAISDWKEKRQSYLKILKGYYAHPGEEACNG